jgi:predicted histone-like DNA-binding protein
MDYKIIDRPMPGRPTEPHKYYATIVRPKNITLEALAGRIAEISPVNELFTESVLNAFVRILPEFLKNGATVELGSLGRFMVNMSSEGAATEDDFDKSLIIGNKISFQPGTKVKKEMQKVEYNKI